ncbi:MAG: hypothetical protein ACRYFU_21335 [Janthinobacterium lividum]
MQTVLEWLHWIRLIAHRHPNGPAWIQGVGSLLAVFVALVIFWRQGVARDRERREDNRIRQLREVEDDRIRREREERIESARAADEWRTAELGRRDRSVRKQTLLIIIWPVLVQTRNRMALVLSNLRREMKASSHVSYEMSSSYSKFLVSAPSDWQRLDRDVFIFGSAIAIAINEMLAIIRQNDADIKDIVDSGGVIDWKMHSAFLMNGKNYADTVTKLLEQEYEKYLGMKPKRAVFWPKSAKAAASQASKRSLSIQTEAESLSRPSQ